MKRVIGALAGTAVLALAGCGGDDEGDVQAFCDQAQEVEAAGASLSALQGNDVDAATEALTQAANQVQDAAEVAPAEIQPDVEQISQFISAIAGKAADANSPQDFLDLAQSFQDDVSDVQQANQNVSQYVADNCDQGG